MKKFAYKSPMQIPRLEKVVVNVGAGDAKDNLQGHRQHHRRSDDDYRPEGRAHDGEKVGFELQAARSTSARSVTLRGDRMYEFVISSSRSRSRASETSRASTPTRSTAAATIPADSEQLIFPEIEYDKVDKIRGMGHMLRTTANTDEEAKEFTLLGAPFREITGRADRMAKTSMKKIKQQRTQKYSTRAS